MPFLTSFAQVKKRGEKLYITAEIDIASAIEISLFEQAKECENNAPLIAIYQPDGSLIIVRGSCNNWTCPRCGQIRARQEYARIMEGVKTIAGQGTPLYFTTITCKGREMSVDEAEKNYLLWTNRLLSTMRADAKKTWQKWEYVAVTERQERGHPHSHFMITYCPTDGVEYPTGARMPNGRVAREGSVYSAKFIAWAKGVGLGKECDTTRVRTPLAVANYVSKYLFKDASNTVFPKGWRRVRYSQSFPKLPKADVEAFALVTSEDWSRLRAHKKSITTQDESVFEYLRARVFLVRKIDRKVNM